MRILITNDDGVFAEGYRHWQGNKRNCRNLYCRLDHEQSATGHAITMHRPLLAEKSLSPSAGFIS